MPTIGDGCRHRELRESGRCGRCNNRYIRIGVVTCEERCFVGQGALDGADELYTRLAACIDTFAAEADGQELGGVQGEALQQPLVQKVSPSPGSSVRFRMRSGISVEAQGTEGLK